MPPKTPSKPPQPAFDPPLDSWPDAGVYQLRLRVSVAICVSVGKLGRITFPPGLYVYTGRAARALRARVLRHVGGARRKHWHIDYLLARRETRVQRVTLLSRDPADECAVNVDAGRTGRAVADRFGASDCRSQCPAHLWLVEA